MIKWSEDDLFKRENFIQFKKILIITFKMCSNNKHTHFETLRMKLLKVKNI